MEENPRVYVDLFGAGLPALAARAPAKCEVFNDLSGNLALLLRHAALHAEALEAAAEDECRDGDGTELSRCIRLFRAAEPNLRGDSFREKLDALRARLARVYIEKLPPAEIVAFFDSPETLFFAPEGAFPRSPLEALVLRSALARAKGRVVSPAGDCGENETRRLRLDARRSALL